MQSPVAWLWHSFWGLPNTNKLGPKFMNESGCGGRRNSSWQESIQHAEEKLHAVENSLACARKIELIDPDTGIMKGSILTVRLMKAFGLPEHLEAFVVLRFGDQEIDSGFCHAAASSDPNFPSSDCRQWNEVFTFNVDRPYGALHVELWGCLPNFQEYKDEDSDDPNNYIHLGSSEQVQLQDFYDQERHSQLLPIKGPKLHGDMEPKVEIDLQWIHSHVAVLERLMQEWKNRLCALHAQRAEIENMAFGERLALCIHSCG